RVFSRAVLLRGGRVLADGPAAAILSEDAISDLYDRVPP
ncbi:ABC transporter ATP-binding protein, partial [Nguyenibacter vanlangensis]|nr:ABC transporter ATP-binding protein [Nguyenibacter vanlangensis]